LPAYGHFADFHGAGCDLQRCGLTITAFRFKTRTGN